MSLISLTPLRPVIMSQLCYADQSSSDDESSSDERPGPTHSVVLGSISDLVQHQPTSMAEQRLHQSSRHEGEVSMKVHDSLSYHSPKHY